jgi:glycosyltransferase involved in cell wall biosynthesis
MKNKSISVIITVFNRNRLLLRALKSVFNQSYKNYEVIIIDDGSTDKVETKLFPILKKHNNITYCRQQNKGNPEALKTGILLANGKYITFLDSDDQYMKNHLESRIYFFKNNPKIDLIYSTATIIGSEKDFFVPDARNKKRLIHLDKCIIGATFFGKREVFINLRGFKNKYSHDFDFYKRAIKSYNVFKLEIPTYIYFRGYHNGVINNLKKNM